jgi:PAS domain S-box-containing protein
VKLRKEGKLLNFEADIRTKSGTIRTALFSGTIIPLGDEPALLTIGRDITDLKLAQDALFESEERFRAAFETSPDSIIIVDVVTNNIVDVSEGFVFNTGYSKEEVLGLDSLKIGAWADPSDRDRFYGAFTEDGRLHGFNADFRMKDGTIKRGLMSARTLELSGHPHLFVIIRDITSLMEAQDQLKASLSEKEILIKEIHHRVKNNLQVISGLLNLQAYHITDPAGREVYKESQNRVITMALIHEELYQSTDLARVHFGGYIRNLCENLMISYGVDRDRIRLIVDAQRIDMVVDTAIPCGLIINELITNALKHAFPDGRGGEVSLTFRELEDEQYQLIISDDGIGMPEGMDSGKTGSLGMQLVRVLVEQLGGALEIERGEGTTFRITFKEYHEAGTALY